MNTRNSTMESKFKKIKELYDKPGNNYHTLKFPNGEVFQGQYDMSKVLDLYRLPDDLKGKTVLDIGTANGFFAIEFFRRGADVVAIDKHEGMWIDEINELMSTKVKFKIKDLTTLDESFGKFDIVFSSNVIQHNTDLFDNIRRIKKVTKHMAILCTQVFTGPLTDHVPFAEFIGKIDPNVDSFGTFWTPNMKCFKLMAEKAGFSRVEEISIHEVPRLDMPVSSHEGIIHCYI